jgi:hypothetical protein
MRFSIAYNEDGTLLTSSSDGEDAGSPVHPVLPEQPSLCGSPSPTAPPRLRPVLREQPSPSHRTETQLTEK